MPDLNPYEGLRDLLARVPEFVQPLVVALAGAIRYIEGGGATARGVFAGIHPLIAGMSGATGKIICVVLVVILSSRVRAAALARRKRADLPGLNYVPQGIESCGTGFLPTAMATTAKTAKHVVAHHHRKCTTPGPPGRKGRSS